MKIEMGKGEWLFSKATDENGLPGLLIRKSEKPYTVGDLVERELAEAYAAVRDARYLIRGIDWEKWEEKHAAVIARSLGEK